MRLRRGALALIAGAALLLTGCTLPTQPEATPAYDLEDFEFESFEASYVLLLEEDGDSRLRTTERMTAVFPDVDQNRGIVRSIPTDPSADAIGFRVVEVTDGSGTRRPFELEEVAGFVNIVIAVPEGEFVHGEQTYEITYQQRGVVTRLDEEPQIFFWDVNGSDWQQPFGTVSADIELVGDLASQVYNEPFCVVDSDVDDPDFDCEMRGGEGFYTAEESDLEPGESLRFAIQFWPGTFG